MKKRLLAVLLTLCLALGTLPLSVLAAEYTATMNGKEITVTTDADNNVTVSDADLNQYYTFTFVAGSGSDADTVKYYEKATGAEGTLTLTPAETPVQKITITFNGGEGVTATPDPVEIESGAAVGTLPTVEREGYNFKGWFTAATGGDKVTAETTFDADATVYAQWEEDVVETQKWTITFELNGGAFDADVVVPETVEDGATLTKPANPTKTGYEFDKWTTDEEGTTEFVFTTAIKANTTLYAQWTEAEGTSTVDATEGTDGLEVNDASKVADDTEVLIVKVPKQDTTEVKLTVSSEVVAKVDATISVQVTTNTVINIPVEVAEDGKDLTVRFDAGAEQSDEAGKSGVEPAITINFTIVGKEVVDLATPITFSVDLSEVAAMPEKPVLAWFNNGRYTRSRGTVGGGVARFSTRHLTEFAVVNADEADPEILTADNVIEGKTGGDYDASIITEPGEFVRIAFTTTKGSEVRTRTIGTTATTPEENGLASGGGSVDVQTGETVKVTFGISASKKVSFDTVNGFAFDEESVFAIYAPNLLSKG